MTYQLRPFLASDAPSLAKHANNKHIARYLTDQFPHPYTLEDAEKFISMVNGMVPVTVMGIEVGGEICGGIGVHPQTMNYKRNAELGYWIAEEHWGKGIVSALIPYAIDNAFTVLDIDRIYARCFGSNKASLRVLEKCGFVIEGKFEKTFEKWGELEDEWVWAIRRQ
jgi:RimJ/RimL family protein N-acetyltransferase